MRQTFRYKVCVSRDFPLSSRPEIQKEKNHLVSQVISWNTNTSLNRHSNTFSFTACQCRAPRVWRCRAPPMSASAPGSHTGRCPYEALLYPEDINGVVLTKLTAGNVFEMSSADFSPSRLPKYGWRWPGRLAFGRLAAPPQGSLARGPDHNQSVCSSLHERAISSNQTASV